MEHLLIFASHQFSSVLSLQPANDKMSLGGRLQMIDENQIDGGTAKRSEDRYDFGSHLVRQEDAEARSHIRHQPDKHRGPFLHHPPLSYEFSRLREGSGHGRPNGKVGGLSRVVRPRSST